MKPSDSCWFEFFSWKGVSFIGSPPTWASDSFSGPRRVPCGAAPPNKPDEPLARSVTWTPGDAGSGQGSRTLLGGYDVGGNIGHAEKHQHLGGISRRNARRAFPNCCPAAKKEPEPKRRLVE